ncbi:P1 family peptidase [Paracidovorax citrulli]|uniref:Peptidase S58, DmpA n=2 Tax=Paracidovorax citrulli TaxID=80869 RepID=A1TN51_PARC0|nr:P1 family peptidase [Paracidovorax citrulli]ABM32389.1 peptidase S58, DmpA [Paracidovorax citrulli AAC00-1]ATG94592.1 peptidase S58 family protein [Paracidovorax citrulli]PVY66605.1 L-aminopeptidase/D-esterase-like protein [Paracidovorax citrulli]REG69228.1 L-aminopeptidase/D-esterase-like protein [Paracidovorax citrulli]RLJ93783.1 L-aminopeptidase/D-esterase-like protein [Paracidovorax citrulli]
MSNRPISPGSITQVAGIEVGHFTSPLRPTGCTVVIAREGAVAGVDVRGAAPGTRETDLLEPTHLVDRIHAVMLAGGSAFGLDAAAGAVRWLEERGIGFDVGVARVPLVPAAVLFDLHVGDARIRPDVAAGYAACEAAAAAASSGAAAMPLAEGCVGAGAGAAVGKLFGMAHAMKGGIGSASVTVDGVTVGALVACNAVGDVVDPETGRPVAGARTADGLHLRDTRRALLAGDAPRTLLAGTNTTIGVVATDAVITKAQARRLAVCAHDGLARAINPVHTLSDGDTLFALGTGRAGKPLGMMLLSTMAAEATARATLRSVLAARSLTTAEGLHLPCAADVAGTAPWGAGWP